jgi:protein subunit release factor B
MNFPDQAPVTPRKKEELRQRILRLGIDLSMIDEQFVRASGPGGQKVNKTSSAVLLRYPPLGLVVKWSRERSRALNQFLALRELVDEVEERVSPETSKRLRERARVRARKKRRNRRAGNSSSS